MGKEVSSAAGKVLYYKEKVMLFLWSITFCNVLKVMAV